MERKKNKLKPLVILIFLAIVLALIGLTSLATTNTQTKQGTSAFAGSSNISLEPYCKDGYYVIPGEDICSRAPNCGGYGYDELNTANKMPNPQKCMGDGSGRDEKGCAGYVPVCCYEVARTGDFTKCIGYWERLWCTKSQCDEARSNGASDSQCGGSCQCGHAHSSYCGENAQAIPIAQRLGGQPTNTPQPQATATPQPPTITIPPNQPTSTPTPIMPTTTPQATHTLVPTHQQPTSRPLETQRPIYSANPTPTSYQPPQTQVDPTQTPTPKPTIHIKSPKELAREVINPQNIQKLNNGTEKVLDAPKEGLITIKQTDTKLETLAHSFFQRVWSMVIKFIKK